MQADHVVGDSTPRQSGHDQFCDAPCAVQRGDSEVAGSLHLRPGDAPSDQLFLVQMPPLLPEPNHKVCRASTQLSDEAACHRACARWHRHERKTLAVVPQQVQWRRWILHLGLTAMPPLLHPVQAGRPLEHKLDALQLEASDREPAPKALSPAQMPDGKVRPQSRVRADWCCWGCMQR